MAANAMVQINNLSKSYKGGKKAVDGLTLTIEKGDIYGFIGHNGAGKTTTIKCIAGILEFDEGEIHVDGHSVKADALACKSIIAYIPDNPDLYENMTGIQYLNFVADIFSIEKNRREAEIKRYADAFELTEHLGSPIASYSHGMKQKLALISAFIHEPRLLILDEPFVGLDPKAAHTMKEFIKELCQRGSAVFFSTHVLEVAEKLCNKIAIIRDGKLVVSGLTEKVKGDSSLEQLFLELIEQ